jgi:hypothetical protein
MFNFNSKLVRSCYHDIIIKVGGEDNSKKYFRDRKMNLREVTMKYDRLIVFIYHDSTDKWGLGIELNLELAL